MLFSFIVGIVFFFQDFFNGLNLEPSSPSKQNVQTFEVLSYIKVTGILVKKTVKVQEFNSVAVGFS